MSLVHHQDAATLIAGSLRLERKISPKVIQQTQNALRMLKLKNPRGSFGKQDNDLKRACALLEYIAREKEGFKIPMEKLAKAACMKEKEFVKFHQIIGNFRENVSSKSSSSSKANGNDAEGQQKSSIPLLSIKLGPFVQDSNGAAVRAQRLFDNILSYAKKMSKTESRYQVRDMRTYQKTYEAACFYFEATRDQTTNSRPLQNQEDEDEKRLEISTVLDVSTDFTSMEFKNVLGHIQNLSEEMESASDNHDTGEAASKNQVSNKKRKNIIIAKKLPAKRSKLGALLSEEPASIATLDLLEKVSEEQNIRNDLLKKVNGEQNIRNDEREIWDDVDSPHRSYSPVFLEWKQKLLAKAIKAAKEALVKKSTDSEQEISYERALNRAATDVLRSHDLLQCK
jgi:hypothetical protein